MPNLYGIVPADVISSRRPETLSGDRALARINRAFEAKQKISVAVSGNTMVPFIYDGDNIVLEKLSKKRVLKRGDVLFYIRGDNTFFVSRVKKVLKSGRLIMCGDAQIKEDVLSRDFIIGVVAEVEHNGEYIDCSSFGWKFRSATWYLCSPIRPTLLRTIYKFR